MENVCRLCLQSGPDLRFIHENSDDTSMDQNLIQLILRYLSIQIIKTENTDGPSICTACKYFIEEWHRFHTSCLQNDEIYQQRLLDAAHDSTQELLDPKEFEEENLATISDDKRGNDNCDSDNEPDEESDENIVYMDGEDDADDVDSGSDCSIYEYEVLDLEPEMKTAEDSIQKKSNEKQESKRSKRGRPKGRRNSHEGTKTAKRAEVCTICGKFIKNITEHMRIHNNERRHQCPYCAKSFVSASNYSSHVNIHTRAKMYSCDLCDKQYALLNSLKQHRITHFKERIYLCPVCGKAYYQPTGLARHKRTHFEQPTIKCSECDKLFLTNGDLKKHFKKHLPEKPFSCEICSRAFNRKDNLKTHMKTHREKVASVDKPAEAAVPVRIKLEITKV